MVADSLTHRSFDRRRRARSWRQFRGFRFSRWLARCSKCRRLVRAADRPRSEPPTSAWTILAAEEREKGTFRRRVRLFFGLSSRSLGGSVSRVLVGLWGSTDGRGGRARARATRRRRRRRGRVRQIWAGSSISAKRWFCPSVRRNSTGSGKKCETDNIVKRTF